MTAVVRNFLLPWVVKSFECTLQFQKLCGVTPKGYSNTGLHVYFSFAASLGNEEFWILFLPALFGQVDNEVGRHAIVFLSIMYYCGQVMKDLLQLPRPHKHPEIVMLETHYETEYGFPSTHSMVAFIPFVCVRVMSRSDKFDQDPSVLMTTAWVWCISMMLSRLYMGVHSLVDVIGGGVMGAGILAFMTLCADGIDTWMVTDPTSGPIMCLLVPILIWLYPRPDKWTNAAGDTALILSVLAGVSLATSANALGVTGVPVEGPPLPTLHDPNSTLSIALGLTSVPYVLRACLAFVFHLLVMTVVALCTRFVVKSACFAVLTRLLPPSPIDAPAGKRYEIELPTKFFTYGGIGFATLSVVPLVVRWLGL